VPDSFAAPDSAALRPGTIVSCAVSVDGYLDDEMPSRLILSGPEDLDEVDALRAGVDAILVGAGTVRKDNPRLLVRDPVRVAARKAAGRSPHPFRVTLTSSGDLDPNASFFTGPGTPLVYCPVGAAARALERLGTKARVIEVEPELTLAAVLADLGGERGVATLLVEGGARVLREVLAADLVDELRLAIAPFFVGDPAAPRFALPAPYPRTAANPMTLVAVRRVGEVAVHHYRLTDRRRPEAVPPG
jgi:5-amino-6-(5-phosphoribosylamino)uracil reductase